MLRVGQKSSVNAHPQMLRVGQKSSRLLLSAAPALCAGLVVFAALAFSGRGSNVEDLDKPRAAGPFWRMPRDRLAWARKNSAAHEHRAAGKMLTGNTHKEVMHKLGVVQRLLADHPDFVREFDALAKRSSAQSLLQALRAGPVRSSPVQRLKLSEAEKNAVLLQRHREQKVRELVRAKHQMLARQVLAEEEAGNTTDSGLFPPENGAFNDWVLTVKPAAINMSNVTWGAWRTPDNSNAYSGMTEPVPNTNPLGEQIIDQDSDTYVNVSDVERGYETNNPLFAALEGKGFPKMGYEQDNFAPCTDPDRCTPANSRASYPVTGTHSDPRTLRAKEKPITLDDVYKNCSDPNNPEYYTSMCDPERNKYGRRIREGGFPDDPMVIEWRLRSRHINALINQSAAAEQDGNFTIYREPVYQANAQGVAGPYLRTPFPSGVAAQPYSATGYYGGLSGPPFVTEGPVGSEVALPSQVPHDLDLGPRPRSNGSAPAPAASLRWEDFALGDGYEDAQSIVGMKHARDTAYRYHDSQASPLDKTVYQPREPADQDADESEGQDGEEMGEEEAGEAMPDEKDVFSVHRRQWKWTAAGGKLPMLSKVSQGQDRALAKVSPLLRAVAGRQADAHVDLAVRRGGRAPRASKRLRRRGFLRDKEAAVRSTGGLHVWDPLVSRGAPYRDEHVPTSRAAAIVPIDELPKDLPHVAQGVEALLDPLAKRVRQVHRRQSTLGFASDKVEASTALLPASAASCRPARPHLALCVQPAGRQTVGAGRMLVGAACWGAQAKSCMESAGEVLTGRTIQVERISRALATWRRHLRQGKPAKLPEAKQLDLGKEGLEYYNELMEGNAGANANVLTDRPRPDQWSSRSHVPRPERGSAGGWIASLPEVASRATQQAESRLAKLF